MTKYRIRWKVTETGATGHGSHGFPLQVAEQLRDKLNADKSLPPMEHWVEPIPEEDAS